MNKKNKRDIIIRMMDVYYKNVSYYSGLKSTVIVKTHSKQMTQCPSVKPSSANFSNDLEKILDNTMGLIYCNSTII